MVLYSILLFFHFPLFYSLFPPFITFPFVYYSAPSLTGRLPCRPPSTCGSSRHFFRRPSRHPTPFQRVQLPPLPSIVNSRTTNPILLVDALQSVNPFGAHIKNAGLRPRVPDTEATAFQKLIKEACYSLSLTPFPPHNKRRTIRRDLPLYTRYNGQLYAGFPNLFPPKETQCRLFIYFISPAPAATSLVGWSGVMVGCHAKADGHLPRIVGV